MNMGKSVSVQRERESPGALLWMDPAPDRAQVRLTLERGTAWQCALEGWTELRSGRFRKVVDVGALSAELVAVADDLVGDGDAPSSARSTRRR